MNIKCPYCHSFQLTNGLNELVCEECNNTIYIFGQNDYKIISYTKSSIFELFYRALWLPVTLLLFFIFPIFGNSSFNVEHAFLVSGIFGLVHPISFKFSGTCLVLESYATMFYTFSMQELTMPAKFQIVSSLFTFVLGAISIAIYLLL